VTEDLLLRELPADLDRARLLEVAGDSGVEGRAQEFDFALCRDPLRSCPYPMALLADLWRLLAPGGVLLLEAEVDPAREHSPYARFVPAATTGAGWVPGRLALRWMIEASGFDVERWLGDADIGADSRAHLRALRSERAPARSAP